MNLKKNLFLIVWGFIIVVLLCACGYLLFRVRGAFVQAKQDLGKAEQSLEALNRRNPFPSRKNVSITETNLVLLDHVFGDVIGHLGANQVEEQPMEGARFLTVLEDTLGRLNEHAMEYGVMVPQQFAFGFDSYAKGSIPERDDVPRLSVQLQMAEALAELLYSNRVTSISLLGRSIFEEGAGGASASEGFMGNPFGMPGMGGMGGMGGMDEESVVVEEESHLYSIEHFDVAFTAKGPNAVNVLRKLAGSRLFAVVTDLKSESATGQGGMSGIRTPSFAATPGEGMGPPGGFPGMTGMGLPPGFPAMAGRGGTTARGPTPGAAEPAGQRYLLREDRIVAGEEILQVTLGVDIYRFKNPRAEEIDPDRPEAGSPDPVMELPSGEETPPAGDPADEALEGIES